MISHFWILNYENVDYFCAVVFITYKHFLLSFDCFFKCVGVSKCSLAVGHFQTYPPSLESKLKRFVYLLSFFPSWSLLVVLFICTEASTVAKVGLRLPGSRYHLGASEVCGNLGIPLSLHLLPAPCRAGCKHGCKARRRGWTQCTQNYFYFHNVITKPFYWLWIIQGQCLLFYYIHSPTREIVVNVVNA